MGWLVFEGIRGCVGRLVGFPAGLDVDVERAVGSDVRVRGRGFGREW